MFEQRRPKIIRDLSCIGATTTLLKEQHLQLPDLLTLPDIVGFFDDMEATPRLDPQTMNINLFIDNIKNLRCWVKHFYSSSTIPELTRVKAL